MCSKFKFQSRFILIKLVILVLIIGLNPGCTENRIIQQSFELEQAEAIHILQQIYIMETAYYQENGVYSPCAANSVADFNLIGMEIPTTAIYDYFVSVSTDAFTATAIADIDDDVTIDTWTIDEDGDVEYTINDVLH